MIFTFGYDGHDQVALRRVLSRINRVMGRCWLIDIRSNPKRAQAGFSGNELAEAFPDTYVHASGLGGRLGHYLYGKAARELLTMAGPENCLLLCKEAAPGDCHRLHVGAELCRQGAKVVHLFYDDDGQDFDVIDQGELARSIAESDDYECTDLESFLLDPIA